MVQSMRAYMDPSAISNNDSNNNIDSIYYMRSVCVKQPMEGDCLVRMAD